jgi:hypothetical protein
MSISTLMVLLLLTFGQILALSIGFLVLWLAGEFEDSEHRAAQKRRQRPPDQIAQRIRATTAAAVLAFGRQAQSLLRSDWMRGHRPLIAACMLLIVTVGLFIGLGKFKGTKIAHFLPPGLTDGSKPTPR